MSMENKYDDQKFFQQYSRMGRSTQGLQGAGEWHELRKLLPNLSGKRVLDLGCGFGWHCRYAVEQGARCVVGIDLSEKMLEVARERNSAPNIDYRRGSIEAFRFPADSFDLVLSSLALHYVDSFAAVCDAVRECLVPGGDFVFSVEHPVFTARGDQQWHEEAGQRLHWPVDRYFQEGERTANFLGQEVRKVHRTLTGYLNTLLGSGFSLTQVVEPRPDPALMDQPGMADELRRPMMLLVSAQKR